jgi:transposase
VAAQARAVPTRRAARARRARRLTSQDEEIRRLRRELAQVREERDILGKATAFFAKGLR